MRLELQLQKLDNHPEGYAVFGPAPEHGEEGTNRFPRPKFTMTTEMWSSLGNPVGITLDLEPSGVLVSA